MKTFDDELLERSLKFIDEAHADGKPFFRLAQPDAHAHLHAPIGEYERCGTPRRLVLYEAGMAQLDDCVGQVQKKIEDLGMKEKTIFIFTTDNGTEVFTWPDGGRRRSREKGMVIEGGFRVPALVSWPGKIPAGKVENGVFSDLDWFPTLVAAAGNPSIGEELMKGERSTAPTYKVHLDGYDQTAMLTGKGPSARNVIWYFAQASWARCVSTTTSTLHRSARRLVR